MGPWVLWVLWVPRHRPTTDGNQLGPIYNNGLQYPIYNYPTTTPMPYLQLPYIYPHAISTTTLHLPPYHIYNDPTTTCQTAPTTNLQLPYVYQKSPIYSYRTLTSTCYNYTEWAILPMQYTYLVVDLAMAISM